MVGNIQGRSPVALSIRNLTKVFRGKGERVTALENVSLDIQEVSYI